MFIRHFQVQTEHLEILRKRFDAYFKKNAPRRWFECLWNRRSSTNKCDHTRTLVYDDELIDLALHYFDLCNFKSVRPDTLYTGMIQYARGLIQLKKKHADGNSILFYFTEVEGAGIVFRGDLINHLDLGERDYIVIHLDRVACLQNMKPRDRSRIAQSF